MSMCICGIGMWRKQAFLHLEEQIPSLLRTPSHCAKVKVALFIGKGPK